MRRVLLIAAFSLVAGSAHAQWQFEDISDAAGPAYAGWVADSSGVAGLELYCDGWFPDILDLTIYTGEAYEPESSYADEGALSVSIDGIFVTEITAFFDNRDGELLVYTSDLDVSGLDQVVTAMVGAQHAIGFGYFDREFEFPAAGVFDVVQKLADDCP